MTTVVPGAPAWMWVIIFVAATAVANVLGVDVVAKMNKSFLCIQLTVLAVFQCWAGVLVLQRHAHLSLAPFHPHGAASWSVINAKTVAGLGVGAYLRMSGRSLNSSEA